MNQPQPATATSARSGRPERPIKHVYPVTAPNGTVGYDRLLENRFDTSTVSRLLPSEPPTRLYDTIARAHDHRVEVTPDVVDPFRPTIRPLILSPRERRHSFTQLHANPADYMDTSSDLPDRRPRRSTYEDRRGAVGVTPSEVNTLIPYIPPIDTSLPPPSREWLDAKAKQFLADAHADFEDSRRNATNDATQSNPPPNTDNDDFFDYDSDSTSDGALTVSRTFIQQRSQQAPLEEPESNSRDADCNSSTETETDTETDTDMDSDVDYNWSTTCISESNPRALADVPRWIIPRKRPSVVIVKNKDNVTEVIDDSNDVNRDTSSISGWDDPASSPSSSDDEHAGKRRRGGKSICLYRDAKVPKRHANDTPVRQRCMSVGLHHISEFEDSSPERAVTIPPPPTRTSPLVDDTAVPSCSPASAITAAPQMKLVQTASPPIASPEVVPQPDIAPTPPKSPKLFPCPLDGCTQVCASAGDLQRHQLSLRHCSPSYNCLACGKSYTRSDALKRHLNSKVSCKRMHTTTLANSAEVEEVQPEANAEAMQVVANIPP